MAYVAVKGGERAIDEGASDSRTYYADADGDGFGDPAVTSLSCGAEAGYVEAGTDCNDADASISPAAVEVCDEVDNNCDGSVDNDAVDGIVAGPGVGAGVGRSGG